LRAVALRLHDNPRSSNAQKVRFLLAEMGLDYDRVTVPFGAERPRWHRLVNPTGGIPALIDGDVVMAESNAILRYLAVREGREDLYPQALPDRGRVEWLLDSVSTMFRELTRPIDAAAFGWRKGLGVGAGEPSPDRGQAALDEHRDGLATFSRVLDQRPGFACLGRFTIADAAAAPFLHRLTRTGLELDGLARIESWAATVLERPAWQGVAAEAGV
jgi:glutathione S-transferase